MKIRRGVTAAAVAGITSAGIALSGIGLVGPADAAQPQRKAPVLSETDYGYQSTAYGTRVASQVVGMESGSTAFSYLSCTRLAGRKDSRTLASVSLPAGADQSYVQVDSIDSATRTFRSKADDVAGAVTSSNRIGKVKLGNSTTPRLVIKGLETTSTAWATLGGKLKTSNVITSGNISLEGVTPDGSGSPLDDLLGAVDDGIGQVLEVLAQNGPTEIPGLGVISIGFDRQVVHRRFAAASSKVLTVTLYGPDQLKGGGDDSEVTIGRSWTRINRDLPAGVMHGVGFGANAKVADGVVKVGRLGEQPLPCAGTEGETYKSPIAGVDFASAGQLVADGLMGQSFGIQKESGVARAWTEGSVADLTLGPLEIKGIVGHANVKQGKGGKIVRNNIHGSSIGEIIVDGESQGALDPKTAKDFPPIEIPGVAKIEFFVKDKTNRGMKTSAVVITMLPDTPGLSEVRLGNAQVHINRY